MGDARLRLGVAHEVHEFGALELDQPVLVDQAAAVDFAAANHARDPLADLGVEGIRRLKLGKEDERLVFSGNFERIYRLNLTNS